MIDSMQPVFARVERPVYSLFVACGNLRSLGSDIILA